MRDDSIRSRTAIVVAGGDAPSADEAAGLPDPALVIAVDSGLHHALDLGLTVHYAVGDFDSVDPALLAAAAAAGTVVERHPPAKDATDLELALERAGELGAERVVVLGVAGGRLDHLLANALALASGAFAGSVIEARAGRARLFVLHGEHPADLVIEGAPGDLVTLLAVHGAARGVRTEGLLYPLAGEDLGPGSTRGVSNECTGTLARVGLDAGTLVVVVPGHRGTHLDAHDRRGTP